MEHFKVDCPPDWLSLGPPSVPVINRKRPFSKISEKSKDHANTSQGSVVELAVIPTPSRATKKKPHLSNTKHLDYLTLSMLAVNIQADSHPALLGYLGILGVVFIEGDESVEVDADFCKKFQHQIDMQWTLIDPKGVKHLVTFEMVEGKPHLTQGWRSVADYYGLTGLNWPFLCLLGESRFELIIFDYNFEQITYQKAPTGIHFKKYLGNSIVKYLNENYVCWFSERLTTTKACTYFLEITEFAIAFMKASGPGTWRMIGPTGKSEVVTLEDELDPSKARFGGGWTRFCQRHALKRGHSLTVGFPSHKSRDIHIFMERVVVDQIPVELNPVGHL